MGFGQVVMRKQKCSSMKLQVPFHSIEAKYFKPWAQATGWRPNISNLGPLGMPGHYLQGPEISPAARTFIYQKEIWPCSSKVNIF